MQSLLIKFLFISVLFFVVFSCRESFTPKPTGYFRIELPEKQYVEFDSCYPYKFLIPAYSKITHDLNKNAEKYWLNISFPSFNSKIHISYKPIDNNASKYFEEARDLAYKHDVKADAISEKVFSNPDKNVYGILYDIKGNAASSLQFYVTDSTNHFLRGALYFNSYPNKDSLAPVIDFLRHDIVKLVESFEWK